MTTTKISLPAAGVNLPISDFRINGERRSDIVLDSLTMASATGKHDGATVNCKIASTSVGQLEQQPISFRVGSSPALPYEGYVYSVVKAQKLQSQVVSVLNCIGVTAKAKSPVFGMLRNTTSDAMSERVLNGVGLGFYSPGNNVQIPRVALTGRSAWDVVMMGAQLTSRMVASYRGAVWVFDPVEELNRRASAFQFRKSIDSYGSGDRTLLDFTPGSARPKVSNQDLPRAAWFVADGSVRTEAPEGDNTFWFNDTHLPSTEYAQALFAAARRKFNLGQTATARVKGITQAIPGMVVDISTGMVDLLTDTYDGLWLVSDIKHNVVDGSFQTELSLIRDIYRRRDPRATYEWFYTRDQSRTYPTVALSADGWVSSWRKT